MTFRERFKKGVCQRHNEKKVIMTEFLLALPSWLLFIIIVGGSAGLSLLALQLLQPRIQALVKDTPNDIIGFIFATVGVVYAVLLAFAVIVVWQDFDAADRSVSAEAAAITV